MLKRISGLIAISFLCFCSPCSGYGQKKITPVDNDPNKPKQPALHYYDKHGNLLEEPVLFLAETDTVAGVKPGPVYPLLYSASVGLNFFDGVMWLFGQRHASYDITASLSLHNWIEPTVEMGIGYANSHPENSNFTYVAHPSFYAKIGANYNFLYKSNPDYQFYLGLRLGYSNFSYEIKDVTVESDYWGQTNHFTIADQRANSFYGQAVAGLKVKIWKRIAMGWSFRYGFMIKQGNPTNSVPWFIPGYGTRALNATFSIIYDIPINTKRKEMPLEVIGEGQPHVSGGIPEP